MGLYASFQEREEKCLQTPGLTSQDLLKERERNPVLSLKIHPLPPANIEGLTENFAVHSKPVATGNMIEANWRGSCCC